jgi:hypothetical protein
MDGILRCPVMSDGYQRDFELRDTAAVNLAITRGENHLSDIQLVTLEPAEGLEPPTL